jgi:hypothetical protein
MDDRELVAAVAEAAMLWSLSYVRSETRSALGDRLCAGVLDTVAEVPGWLADPAANDVRARLLRHVSFAPGDVQRWFRQQLAALTTPV